MRYEILRYLFLVLPFVFGTTTASLIIWGEDIKKILPSLIAYSLLSSFTQTLTYQISSFQIQFPLEVISGFLIAGLIFRKKWQWIFKIYATAYILSLIYVGILVLPAGLLLFPVSYPELQESPFYWMIYLFPAYILLIPIVYIIKKAGLRFRALRIYFGPGLEKPYPVFIAAFIQLMVFTALLTTILKTVHENNIEVATGLISVVVLISISLYLLIKYYQQHNLDVAIYSQQAISENVMELVNSVKGQRHDYLNNLQVVCGLASQNKTAELNEYLRELLQEVGFYNEILKIDNPIVSALINAKISQANLKGVKIEVDIQSSLTGFEIAAMNIARILANLIDNAVDAVLADEVVKKVRVIISEEDQLLLCTVSNPVTRSIDRKQVFSPGATSKDGHSGLGLYNCRKLAQQLHGKLELTQEEGQVSFMLTVPRKGPVIYFPKQ